MGLKVFDLQCANGHLFEGWFSSHEDYDSQQARGMMSCPVCQSDTIEKKLSAPRLNVGQAVGASSDVIERTNLQASIIREMREHIRNTENVGARFADEARRIHEGESDDRPIRGTATPQERESLAQDGIAVVAVPEFLDTDRLQ